MRSMTQKEKRIRDEFARRFTHNDDRTVAFKAGWDECFEHFLREEALAKTKVIEVEESATHA
jgi:hypothetical protein